MAARLSRLPWSALRKNQFHYTQFLVLSNPDNTLRIRSFSTQQQNSRTFQRTVKGLLTYTLFISGVGYILYKWKDDFHKRINNFVTFAPVVHAKSLPVTNVSHNRDRYNFIADVVETTVRSVVYIEIVDSRRTDYFIGKPMTVSNGSGFIVGGDGLILTNAHVVANKPNSRVKVRLFDGTTYTGVVEDVDMHGDLATVRINKVNLPVMKLGTSSNIRPGEFVVAIGSPLSLNNTITSGVVSSVNRESKELGLYNRQMQYIQTDAAITFGNSGGPLVNLNGEAIGINAMKVTAGISFAIPIDYAKDFLKKAESRKTNKGMHNVSETPHRRYIGITMLTLTPDIIFELQQRSGELLDSVKHGIFVCRVAAGSPAHMSGLRIGDIITHVNDQPVAGAVNIYSALEKAGDLTLTVVRKMEVLQVRISPEDL